MVGSCDPGGVSCDTRCVLGLLLLAAAEWGGIITGGVSRY